MSDDKRTQMGAVAPRVKRDSEIGEAASAASPVASTGAVAHATSYLPPVALPADPLVGATLAGRYLINKKLGEGGMGAVYLATHVTLEKQVALKVLHAEFARKPDLVERFIQEAKAASRIRHENVIDISDFGQTPDGVVFFAMELLQGHDLHEEISRVKRAGDHLPWARTWAIFSQICNALVAAHDKGIVHRDLKPENIYLVEFLGRKDFVKLLDFGIAKMTEVAENDRKLTKTGMLFGTPEYMAPEQARGETADARVDVYAMACILYQLITNRVPFEADNFMSVLTMHLTEPAPQPSPELLAMIGAPPEVASVITKGLEKDRKQRFQSMVEFTNALRALAGEPEVTASTPALAADRSVAIAAKPASASPTVPPSASSPSKSSLPLVAAGLFAVAVAGGLYVWKGRAPSAAAPTATPPAAPAGAQLGSAHVPLPGAGVTPPPPVAGSATSGTLAEGPAGATITAPAARTHIMLTIDSVPSGASVYTSSGALRGTTPTQIRLQADTSETLTLKAAGFKDTKVPVEFSTDGAVKIALVKGKGAVTVAAPTLKPTPLPPASAPGSAPTGAGSNVATVKTPDAGATPTAPGTAPGNATGTPTVTADPNPGPKPTASPTPKPDPDDPNLDDPNSPNIKPFDGK